MTAKIATLTVQKWGNSLAVRIPATIARSVHFDLGTPVELTAQEGSIVVRPVGKRKLTLKERLDMFDPNRQAGEVMASGRIGSEKF